MLLFCVVMFAADPPKELPTVDAVRKALKANLDRMANRRVKYVIVTLPGEPKKEFPLLDHPDRTEVEETWSKSDDPKAERSYIRRTTFKKGALWQETIDARDGKKFTSLKTETTKKGLTTTVDIRFDGRGHSEIWAFEMSTRGLFEGLEHERLGIRSAIKPSPLGGNLVELNPRVDERSDRRQTYTLDPSKNYWPIRHDSEFQTPGGNANRSRLEAIEFFAERGPLIPKRVTQTYPSHGETRYYTAVSVEFPAKFDDDAFAVVIPDGASVTDSVGLKTYKQGSGKFTPFPEPLQPGMAEDLRNLRKEDLLVYGGFVAAVVLVVGAAYFLMTRKRKSARP
jgi:outer membrane lipoprotein-sorting protein